jgi:hypothetical protein
MQLRGTGVIPAAVILVAALVAGLPGSASAQEVMKRGFTAIRTSTPMGQRVLPTQLLPSTSMTFKQPRALRQTRPQWSSRAPLAARITLAVFMGWAGAGLGAEIGARLEGDCHCDDPGLKGALIGMPIGAVTGVALGLALTR